MPDLRRLFQDTLLDHYRHPRHVAPLAEPTSRRQVTSRACGDSVVVEIQVDRVLDRVSAVSVITRGCTIAVSSGSLAATAIEGADRQEAIRVLEDAIGRVEGRAASDSASPLAPLDAVRDFPVRIGCATLPLRALLTALRDADAHHGPTPPPLIATTE